jgi:hypothetical protein
MPRPRLASATLLSLAVALPAAANPPRVDYMLQCQGCHLADGAGAPGKVPPLKDFVGRFLEVPGGREFLVRVPGSATSPLSDARLAAVLNWIIGEFGPAEIAADFTPFTEAEVARVRRPPLVEVESTREALLRAME